MVVTLFSVSRLFSGEHSNLSLWNSGNAVFFGRVCVEVYKEVFCGYVWFLAGRAWTVWFVIPVQFGVCFVTLIGVILTGGYGCKVSNLNLTGAGLI